MHMKVVAGNAIISAMNIYM